MKLRAEKFRPSGLLLKIIILGAFCLFLSAALQASGREPEASTLQIGVPNDSGGLLFRYLVGKKNPGAAGIGERIKLYPLQDCCTTSTEWALSGNRLDLAVLCPDAARRFLDKNTQFQNFGPLLVNADVLVIRPGRTPKKIAVSRKRDYQIQWIRDRWGIPCEPVKMNYAVVPFAYERNLVDGAVVDILKALHLRGDKLPLAGGERDLLVGKRKVLCSPQGKELAAALDQAVRELNDFNILKTFLQESEPAPGIQDEAKQWRQMKVRFTLPPKMKKPYEGRE
jgi:hypothetical protein